MILFKLRPHSVKQINHQNPYRLFILLVFVCFFIFIPIISQASGELFVWTPDPNRVPLVIMPNNQKNNEFAVRDYLYRFNQSQDLRKLTNGILNLDMGSIKALPPSGRRKVRILALANDPKHFLLDKNQLSWYHRFERLNAEVYLYPLAYDHLMTDIQRLELYQKLHRNFNGILALGGADIIPSLYNEKNLHSRNVNLTRDLAEQRILNYFLNINPKPCVGICRGAQNMAVAMGYKLIQDISAQTNNLHNHVTEPHELKFVNATKLPLGTLLERILTAPVNSFHHQAIYLDSNPKGPLVVLAVHQGASDETAIPEILTIKDRPVLLLQFHPELMNTLEAEKLLALIVEIMRENMQIPSVIKNKTIETSCQLLFSK